MSEQLPKYSIDMDRLTLGEIETFEEMVGVFPDTAEQLAALPKAKMMLALGLIALKRVDPNATIDQARLLEIDQLDVVNGETDTPT